MKTITLSQFIGKGQIIDGEGCLSIAFYRPSASNDVFVGGVPIEAGKTLSIAQNVGDGDYSRYDVFFTIVSPGSVNELYVIKIMPLVERTNG